MGFQKGHLVPIEWREKIKLARSRQVITDEHKKKISQSLKGRIPWNKGKKLSKEIKKRMSEAHKGKSSGMKGKHCSEEHKRKLREANKGKKRSNETIKKIKVSAKIRQDKLWQNPEYRKKISDAHKGQKSYWKNKKRPEITGKNCHLWRGGRTKLVKQIRESVEYKKWRREVFENGNYTCKNCRKKGCRIQADHYPESFSQILKENKINTLEKAINCKKLWDTNNGRVLCLDCHKKTDNYLNRWEQYTGKKGDKSR